MFDTRISQGELTLMSRYKYEMLLAAQILLSFVSPLFSSSAYARPVVDLGITIVFATAIIVISSKKIHLVIGMVLMVPTLLSLIHISEPTRLKTRSRMPSSA